MYFYRQEECKTMNLIAHTAKILLRIIKRRINEKLNIKKKCCFRKEVGTRDASELQIMIG